MGKHIYIKNNEINTHIPNIHIFEYTILDFLFDFFFVCLFVMFWAPCNSVSLIKIKLTWREINIAE